MTEGCHDKIAQRQSAMAEAYRTVVDRRPFLSRRLTYTRTAAPLHPVGKALRYRWVHLLPQPLERRRGAARGRRVVTRSSPNRDVIANP